MKINVEIECTPAEAREVVGLPDMAPVHDAFIAQLQDTFKSGVAPDLLVSMLQSWSPMGDAGMKMWQGLFDRVIAPGKK